MATLQNSANSAQATVANAAARQLVRQAVATVITAGASGFDTVRLSSAAQDSAFTRPGKRLTEDDVLFLPLLVITPGT